VGLVRKLLGRVRKRVSGPERPASVAPKGWNQAVKERPTSGLECTITFANVDAAATVPKGTSILDAALEAGVDLNHYCGGMCSCGSCRIVLVSGDVSALVKMEQMTLDVVREGEQDRLGCQTLIQGDVVVEVPDQQF
jgi:2Fe-2S ferredoxin